MKPSALTARWPAIASACLCLALPSGGQAFGATFDVYPGQLIQDTINACVDGDEIIVHPGTYYESIDLLGLAITVRSTDPNDPDVVAATVIDGGATFVVVLCGTGEGSDTVLSGLTITNGSFTWGGGMYNWGSSPTVTNCTF
ncbi:MAG: hypothetical protein ACYTGC_07650, partial [Planctomycetota bacterium]